MNRVQAPAPVPQLSAINPLDPAELLLIWSLSLPGPPFPSTFRSPLHLILQDPTQVIASRGLSCVVPQPMLTSAPSLFHAVVNALLVWLGHRVAKRLAQGQLIFLQYPTHCLEPRMFNNSLLDRQMTDTQRRFDCWDRGCRFGI